MSAVAVIEEAREDQALSGLVQDGVLGDRRNPLFGGLSGAPDIQRTTTMPDAVRRARWIAVDINAESFGLFFATPMAGIPRLTPCFDSRYPDLAPETMRLGGEDHSAIVKHLHLSSAPLWWSADAAPASGFCLEGLGWATRIEPLVPGTIGIALPLHAGRGRCGLATFMGRDMTLTPSNLFDIHARCFSLFEAVARIRPGDSARVPSISRRELECLRLTANGYTSEEIARLLKLSVHTANQYLTNTTQKLDAMSRMHAVAKALRLGLIE